MLEAEQDQKFLTFHLGDKDTAVISLSNITEVLQVSPLEICGVPQMPSCVAGIYNWRGEMLWLIDIENMLGYESLAKNHNITSKMMAVVVRKEDKYLGLLVRQLMDIESFDRDSLKPANLDLFSHEIASFLEGYFIDLNEKMIISLDAKSIIDSPMWSIHN
ncbi:purine-binding chemotaxis protein cheW [Calothrix sp. NIES-4071]|nr:purine-binding chemotaxis protein cheW [Calothrix sp. NIES-4071]BAZ56416.1 purine-binding chemotaxis protein cheW [Calothrix sp. NIES-4105]